MAVREAELSDIPAIKVLGGYAFSESLTYRNMTPDFDALERMVLEDPSFSLFVSQAEDGTLNGFLLGQLQRGLFFKEKIATNVIFYVLPQKRGTNIAFRLARKFQKWALMNDVAQIHLSTSGGINLDSNRRFFTRMGFRQVGILCVREVNNGLWRRGTTSAKRSGNAVAAAATATDSTAECVSARAVFDSTATA